MRYLKLLLLCGCALAWSLSVEAAQLQGLYEAKVEAADQSRAVRATAMSEAMAAVLIKVNGSASVLQEEAIQAAIADASRYVRQFRYHSETIPVDEREGTPEGEPAAESKLFFWARFDAGSIDNLLRRYGFNVWSAARPTTLVWLGVEEGARRVLVGANDQGLVREVLEAESERRAIPLRLPLLDLTDQSRVRDVDVWGGFVDNIEAASQRYETAAVLIGKLYPVGSQWQARWTLSYQGERYEWQHSSEDVSAVIASGVGGTGDYLSQRFAETSYLGIDQLALRIEGVQGMDGFRRVSDYLNSLHGVTSVILRKVDANASSFLIQVEGGREAVLQAISLGDVLVKVEQPVPLPLPSTEFTEPSPEKPAQSEVNGPDPSAETVEPLPQAPQSAPFQELVFRLLS